MLNERLRMAFGVAVPAVVAACVTESEPIAADAAVDVSRPVPVRDAGPLPAPPVIQCGGGSCPEPSPTPLRARACCLEGGPCGVTADFLEGCVSMKQPGGVDISCPSLTLPGSPPLQGCCSPRGTCGILDRFGEFGCIPNEQYGRAASTCQYDANNDCSQIVEVLCDDPMDCGGGQQCCGRRQSDSYDAFGCFDSCDAISDSDVGLWVELRVPAEAGSSSRVGVVCGDGSCDRGAKCCLRPPRTPYCAPRAEPCGCDGQPLDVTDGGLESPDSARPEP